MRHVCFHHAGCPDGFGAAWAVWKKWGSEGEYRPLSHDDALPMSACEGAFVAFVDIAPDNEQLRELAEAAVQLVVLDHHVSARDRYEADQGVENALRAHGHKVVFDLGHSGAVLAWQHFHPDEPVPQLLRYVEDQDLWTWKLPHSEEVNSALGSYPRTFEAWDELARRPAQELAREGEPIVRSNRIELQRVLASAHPVTLAGRRVEAVNAVRNRSAIGHALAQRATFGLPIGLLYRLTGRRVDVSVYSIGELDVARIAAEHGGGGHRNAAGFSVTLQDWLERFL